MPKLKTTYDKEEDIPAGFGELYADRGGKFELTGVEGIKTQSDIDKLNEGIRKERADHKITRDKLTKFGDIDPEVLPTQLAELEETKAQLATAIKDGKIDPAKNAEAIDAAVRRALGPVEREKTQLQRDLDAARKATDAEKAQVAALNGAIVSSKIQGTLRDAAVGSKVIATAIDDAVMNGVNVFEVTEDGRILTKDNTPGVTPGLTPTEWLKDMQEKKPHWWPASQGGGSGGGRGGLPSRAENPWTAEGWNISKQGAFLKANGEAKALEAARSAGLNSLTASHPAAAKAA